jgi:hypothetical protein
MYQLQACMIVGNVPPWKGVCEGAKKIGATRFSLLNAFVMELKNVRYAEE